MASNREERLQMRQRGAATRKIKEVNFGFSFGLAPSTLEEPSQPTSQPDAIVPEPSLPPQTSSVPENAEPPRLSPTRRSPRLQEQGTDHRIPGSARNGLPERPSTFDIPSDDALENGRTPKRRKLDSPSMVAETSGPNLESASTELDNPQPVENGTKDTIAKPDDGSAAVTTATIDQQEQIPPEASEIMSLDKPETPPEEQTPLVERILEVGNKEQEPSFALEGPSHQEQGQQMEPSREFGTKEQEPSVVQELPRQEEAQWREPSLEVGNQEQKASPTQEELPEQGTSHVTPGESSKTKRKRRESKVDDRSSAESIEQPDSTEEGTQAVVQPSETSREDSAGHVEEAQPIGPPRQRGRKGRRLAAAQTTANESKEPEENQASSAENTKRQTRTSRRRLDDIRKDHEHQEEIVTTNGERNNAPSVEANGNHSELDKSADRGEDNHESPLQQAREKRKKRNAGRPRAPRTVEEEPEPDPEPEQEPEQEPEPEPEPDVEPQPQPQPQAQEPSPPKKAAAPKRGRGRPSLSKRPEAEPAEHREQQSVERDDAEIETRSTRRKSKPRGETVPVTVHRLANAAALRGIPEPIGSSDDEESADELSTRQKTKLPNRGGVNIADVLGQICRETLEKTITTLQNGIANESNPARRSEWTRKKKAVEAFGVELEGRLFELSEILDSNFILGMQLKKAKREMMDLRGRLQQVRREREGVALQMDAVRKKHADEEDSKMTRSTINSSLHSLELALDRSQSRATMEEQDSGDPAETTTAGLEFLLCTVAENVSSSAPGARGGILNQIKAFNAQLEAAAQRLES